MEAERGWGGSMRSGFGGETPHGVSPRMQDRGQEQNAANRQEKPEEGVPSNHIPGCFTPTRAHPLPPNGQRVLHEFGLGNHLPTTSQPPPNHLLTPTWSARLA